MIVSSILVMALLGMNVAWANGWETLSPPNSTAQWHPKALLKRLDQYIRHQGRMIDLEAIHKDRPDLAISEKHLVELAQEQNSVREQLFLGAWFASIELFVTGMRVFVGTGVILTLLRDTNLGIFLWPVVALFTFTGSIARTVVLLVFKLRRPELKLGLSMLAALIPFYVGTGLSFLLFKRAQNHPVPIRGFPSPHPWTLEMAI